MNRKNLKRAIDFLKDDPPPHFDMTSWFSNEHQYNNIETYAFDAFDSFAHLMDHVDEENICGTSACWAGSIQWRGAVTDEDKSRNAGYFAADFLELPSFYDIYSSLSDEQKGELIGNCSALTSSLHMFFRGNRFYGHMQFSKIKSEDVIKAASLLYNCSGDLDWILYRFSNYLTGNNNQCFEEWLEDNPQPQIPIDEQI